ncbi:DUF896 domain-containing protein [Clostridium sp.]|uniref:DUF896 domain-containing protein n=1 Tax=Clostridium sp. TaxID=1506 RepID=UPI0026179A46|nr:DUF896 domain-containing protein [Clostridium sp.]
MHIEELTKRINELHKKHKEEGLSEEEHKEREELRREYINRFKNNLRDQLKGIEPKNKKN